MPRRGGRPDYATKAKREERVRNKALTEALIEQKRLPKQRPPTEEQQRWAQAWRQVEKRESPPLTAVCKACRQTYVVDPMSPLHCKASNSSEPTST